MLANAPAKIRHRNNVFAQKTRGHARAEKQAEQEAESQAPRFRGLIMFLLIVVCGSVFAEIMSRLFLGRSL
ncbi:hypothetical protein CXG81DRAFT_23918 [Caulochytrium protostelioides]|uniref:Stress-associated endoplasmic reticulum protein n=1 Tax=Caulochytrium protostelioides TaxID=1555241 RepID=A0A4P9XD71_9FUNG|nr:hypothetical protein CXG81DRAFT_23918 [Caulochytrium protostelioides]|eukprot:RKP03392.1 hypothetical protein CXG81DRAFT_23918 [Caulochytrium protostelioides]